jgi:hypothetical protein
MPSNLTGEKYYKDLKKLPTGETICNERFKIIITDWDTAAREQLNSGIAFRITEKGKTDVNLEPGLHSIHSPLYGTDWNYENAFEDRCSCLCGRYIGRRWMDKDFICPYCKQPVRFIDTNLLKTGWFILEKQGADEDSSEKFEIIIPAMYYKLAGFFGKQHLYQMLKYVPEEERSKYMDEKSSPFYGIGMIEFRDRFDEIVEFYYKRNHKIDGYEFIQIHRDLIFVHSIPCYNMALRKWMVRNGDIKYSKEDKIFQKLYSDHMLLNDNFEWRRRVDYRVGRRKDPTYLRKENILHRIQGYVNELWDMSFDTINKKEGVINNSILGGRLNYVARNVIVPDPTLRADEIGLGYVTFLELYKFELFAMVKKLYNISSTEAWNRINKASVVFSPEMYKLMVHFMNTNELYLSIDRNPSINYGSYFTCKVVEISKDPLDYCLALPTFVLTKANADFDGDITNIFCHKLGEIGKAYFKSNNPRSNMCISRNDGLYDTDSSLFKDGIVGLYAFNNI